MNKPTNIDISANRTKATWLTADGADFADFERQTSQQTRIEDWPQARSVEKNVPIYDGDFVRNAARDTGAFNSLTAEINAIFRHGPGVLIIQNAHDNHEAIDRASSIFEDIIREQHATNQGGSDHFAKPGANDRIWNSLQKHAHADPENFIYYYANEALSLASTAWLGPGYQVTAQVNVVNPGGAAQSAHRDYHLGFMTTERALQYPAICHEISPFMTLQGGIAHCDVPLESGPTKLLPHSQNFSHGYAVYPQQDYQDYFEKHHVQLEMKKGDMLFFNPALMHAAGENRSTNIRRMVNLFQVSSAFGRALENVDRAGMIKALYPTMRSLVQSDALSVEQAKLAILAAAEDYPFPTNLDTDPPVGGLVPRTQAAFMMEALAEGMTPEVFNAGLGEMMLKRPA